MKSILIGTLILFWAGCVRAQTAVNFRLPMETQSSEINSVLVEQGPKSAGDLLDTSTPVLPNRQDGHGLVSWAKKHRRFLTMEGIAVAAAVIHQTGMRHCRRGDVEKCDEGYGSANAWFWMMTTNSVVVFPAIAEACWKGQDDGWKFCHVFANGSSTYQLVQGIRDWRTYAPKEKADLSKVELVH